MAAVQSRIYTHIAAAERFIYLRNVYVPSQSERGKEVKGKNTKKHFLFLFDVVTTREGKQICPEAYEILN